MDALLAASPPQASGTVTPLGDIDAVDITVAHIGMDLPMVSR
ncbi:hypothetical protein ACFYXF_38150 [Streptomyces sp. NPDC002680]